MKNNIKTCILTQVLIFVLFITGCGKSAPESGQGESVKCKETELGSFYTRILDTDPERVNNLKVCANALNGFEIPPGEVFSFNGAVGERTKAKGYEEARILIGDEAGCAVGGGVCQISSTLYNAAKNAGMAILERHDHKNEVHYVEIGNDAAVSYGTLDFKFKNISGNTAKIYLSVENGYVYAKICIIS